MNAGIADNEDHEGGFDGDVADGYSGEGELLWNDAKRTPVTTVDALVEYDSYNLLKQITGQQQENEAERPENADSPIYTGSHHTVSDFAEAFSHVVAVNKMEERGATQMLSLIKQFFPDANLPCENKGFGNTINRTKQYLKKKNSIIDYDVCRGGCCVFVGDFKDLDRCPTCHLPRFRSCRIPSCRGLILIMSYAFVCLIIMCYFLFVLDFRKKSFPLQARPQVQDHLSEIILSTDSVPYL